MKFLGIFLMLLFSAGSLQAASCYSSGEAEAEQGLRIHSELMVIGLNCQAMPLFADKNLYGEYRAFTATHEDLFAAYEAMLLEYFTRNGAASPKAELNNLRTSLANKISQDAAGMRPDVFCVKFAPRIGRAAGMSREGLREWAGTFYPSHPVSRPLCE